MGNQDGKAPRVAFPPISILRENGPEISKCGRTSGHGVQNFGTFCPIGQGRRTRAFIYALPAAETSPLFPPCQPQTKLCFPAASNAPRPPGWQRYFHGNADRAYNTLHFASQSRVPNGALPPLETPTTNRRYAPRREHSACCCQQPVSRSAFSSL